MNTGVIYKTKNCGDIVVVKYNNASSVEVRFLDTGFERVASSSNIKNGTVKDQTMPIVHGIGYIGVGEHKAHNGRKGTREYKRWTSILERCYSDRHHKTYPSYIGCTVCEEWHNFQNFAQWFKGNFVEGYDIDKDILVQGNKTYSPETCVFAPKSVNRMLSVRVDKTNLLPTGVAMTADKMRFVAKCNDGSNLRHIGVFETKEEAHNAYVDRKLEVIHKAAMECEEPIKSALLKHKVKREC